MTGADYLLPLRTKLRSMRTESFGADPAGARMERIRRSPHFVDGAFQNPVGARIRPSGSTVEFAKTYFQKEQRVLRTPNGSVPVHPTTLADLAAPPVSGLRLTWMGHSSVLAEIDGRRILFDRSGAIAVPRSRSPDPSGCTPLRCRWPRSGPSTSS